MIDYIYRKKNGKKRNHNKIYKNQFKLGTEKQKLSAQLYSSDKKKDFLTSYKLNEENTPCSCLGQIFPSLGCVFLTKCVENSLPLEFFRTDV